MVLEELKVLFVDAIKSVLCKEPLLYEPPEKYIFDVAAPLPLIDGYDKTVGSGYVIGPIAAGNATLEIPPELPAYTNAWTFLVPVPALKV